MNSKLLFGLGIGFVSFIVFNKKNTINNTNRTNDYFPYDYDEIITGNPDPNEKIPLIIIFHGVGSNGKNMKEFFVNFDKKARFIFPNAPNKYNDLNNNFEWWHLRSKTENQDQLANDMLYAIDQFEPFLIELIHSYNPSSVIVGGHSQGGMMATTLGLLKPNLIDGNSSASIWIPQKIQKEFTIPNYIFHGTKDLTIKFDRTNNWLNNINNENLVYTPIDSAGHSLGNDNLKNAWIQGFYDMI